MENMNIKRLVVTVTKRINEETGELFNVYKVSNNKGNIYDLKFRKEVPEESRPKVSSYVYVDINDINLQKKNRIFPIMWVHNILGSEPIVANRSEIDDMFDTVEVEEDEELEDIEAKEDEELEKTELTK